ncbi:hypothetical protein PV327_010199 [Microctonus hyperodae]|uniref:Uncharacterized protein n=1 Tax=Microctonus hyperodae TaxID=165561 RepID=A0AA39KUP1_MICHY|nr:hypothetical protein PV327_010199 [Microctonus hyperodae]
MWRATKRLLVDCIQYGVRCIQPDLNDEEVDDEVSDYEDDDVSVQYQLHTVSLPLAQPLQHRPDAPGTRRRSPPEVVMKVRQAIEEMTMVGLNKAQGDHVLPSYPLLNDKCTMTKIK